MRQVKTIDKQAVSNDINQMSDQLGCKLGSALSYNSFATLLSPEYPIAFIGLNPGGNKYDKPTIESENGKCAYYYENWTAKSENKKTPPDEEELAPLQQPGLTHQCLHFEQPHTFEQILLIQTAEPALVGHA